MVPSPLSKNNLKTKNHCYIVNIKENKQKNGTKIYRQEEKKNIKSLALLWNEANKPSRKIKMIGAFFFSFVLLREL